MESHLPCPPLRTASLRCCSGSSESARCWVKRHRSSSTDVFHSPVRHAVQTQACGTAAHWPADISVVARASTAGDTADAALDHCCWTNIKIWCWRKLSTHLPFDNLYFWMQLNWWVIRQNGAFVHWQKSDLNIKISIWALVWGEEKCLCLPFDPDMQGWNRNFSSEEFLNWDKLTQTLLAASVTIYHLWLKFSL